MVIQLFGKHRTIPEINQRTKFLTMKKRQLNHELAVWKRKQHGKPLRSFRNLLMINKFEELENINSELSDLRKTRITKFRKLKGMM